MAKYCPIVKEKVLYLECLECEDKVCKSQDKEAVPVKKEEECAENAER